MSDTASDGEIIEIFVEEAGEVFNNIDNHLPVWGSQPNDTRSLSEIRRSFHTLKGSGRMVDALDLSEVAWKVENMLNHAIEGTVQVTEPMVELVSRARVLLQRMLDDFKSQRTGQADKEAQILMTRADALAEGQTLESVPVQPAAATANGEKSSAFEIGDLKRRIERSQQRSDEALNRSEMARQEARRFAAELEKMQEQIKGRVSGTDVNSIIERVNLLGKQVMNLRQDAHLHQAQQPSRQREIAQMVERCVREQVGPIERQRKELERQLTEARRADAAARRLASWALALSLLVGIGVIIVALLMSGVTFG
jgi:chemotaxis protein histidine kinase CheA